MRWRASKLLFGLGLAAALACGCAADPPPDETTADGLVRVPARSVGGVYRAPDATFVQYQRVILEPPSISFIEDWVKNHPEVSPTEIARLRAETVKLFRDEFAREFVKRGPYKFAEEPAPDVLLVIPAIEELDIKTPESGMEPGNRTYLTGRPVTMKVTGDLRDAVTGKVVGRVIIYHPPEQNPNSELRLANRTANAQEQRRVFADWSLLVHEALNVAKAAKPRTPRPAEQTSAAPRRDNPCRAASRDIHPTWSVSRAARWRTWSSSAPDSSPRLPATAHVPVGGYRPG
jgi:hypothetical protein